MSEVMALFTPQIISMIIEDFGVSLSAVAEALKQTVKYSVEHLAGMVVDKVNVNIVGVKL